MKIAIYEDLRLRDTINSMGFDKVYHKTNQDNIRGLMRREETLFIYEFEGAGFTHDNLMNLKTGFKSVVVCDVGKVSTL